MVVLVVVGAQWGDEGKGKITDYLASQGDLVVRYQGGANAGHTVVIGDDEYRLHLIPSGITAGCQVLIGSGVVVDPELLLREMHRVSSSGLSLEGLHIAETAHVVFPYHKLLDQLQEDLRCDDRVGTTLRGIGPAYTDKVSREGIRMIDLVSGGSFAQRLHARLQRLEDQLSVIPFSKARLLRQFRTYGQLLEPYLCDASDFVLRALNCEKKILMEGAQGTMLDVDHGTYPFVTSSSPTAGGACTGVGLGPTSISNVLGVVKAYTSRVGGGPFPTELTGSLGDQLRTQGQEFGTTTGRPRRCGWLDGVALRYATRVNGLGMLCLSNLDVLSGFDQVKIAVSYEYQGAVINNLPPTAEKLAACRPVYETLCGWDADISECSCFSELPEAARRYIATVEEISQIPVALISVGPRRSQTIKRREVW